jgi:acyl-CoA reductase-like NAD-dependent aldehyde dehydrogenase
LKELATEVNKLLVADGLEDGAILGPVQNKLQFEKVKDLLADIESKNLRLAAGSTRPSTAGKGYFITPTVVDNPPEDSRIVVEEPFGTLPCSGTRKVDFSHGTFRPGIPSFEMERRGRSSTARQ